MNIPTPALILIIFTSGLPSLQADSDNLLENGNFEEWDSWVPGKNPTPGLTVTNDEIPVGWKIISQGFELGDDPAFPSVVAISRGNTIKHGATPP